MGQLFWLSPNFRIFAWRKNPENCEVFEKWAYFSRKILKNGYPFLPKSPLNMGRGFEARAAHPCPTQIWVPPGVLISCYLNSFVHMDCKHFKREGKVDLYAELWCRGVLKKKDKHHSESGISNRKYYSHIVILVSKPEGAPIKRVPYTKTPYPALIIGHFLDCSHTHCDWCKD